jgi:mannan endo-1,4-beta-mannosidase
VADRRRFLPKRLLPYAIFALCTAGCSSMNPSPPLLGVALDGYPITSRTLASVREEFPVTPEIVLFYLQWPANPRQTTFPAATLAAIEQTGAVPCLTWEPMYLENGKEHAVGQRAILDGDYDAYLLEFAAQARLWGKPFIIRFAHEMNLSRYHWGTIQEEYGPQSPEIYRAMYRHVVDVFRRQGADQVLWAFVPNVDSVPDLSYDPKAGWNRFGNYYPGDDYVDILGVDGYNWGTSKLQARDGWQSRWLSFEQLFSTIVPQLRSLSAKKPLLVFETASTEQGGNRERWFAEALETAARWDLAGLIWFQADKEEKWRLRGGALPGGRSYGDRSRQWLQSIKKGS